MIYNELGGDSMNEVLFCDLNNISNDVLAWGNKAVILSKLSQSGLPVPKGFVVNSIVFQQYKRLRNSNGFEPFVEELNSELNNCICQLDLGEYELMFRSSADAEGVQSACFCGIFDSYKYERGQVITEPLLSVWNSTFSRAADLYLSTIDLTIDSVNMAVIVQRFFDGTIFGTIQTRDIIKDNDSIIIEYGLSCCDAVVSGRNDTSMIVLRNNGALLSEDCSVSISDIQRTLLYNMAKSVENVMLSPVEIEFSINKTDVAILQARILS